MDNEVSPPIDEVTPVEPTPEEATPEVVDEFPEEMSAFIESFNEFVKGYDESQKAAVEADKAESELTEAFRAQLVKELQEPEEPAGSAEIVIDAETKELLTVIAHNTQSTETHAKVATASYYGDLGVIITVFGILPVYAAYRFIKPIFGLTRYI